MCIHSITRLLTSSQVSVVVLPAACRLSHSADETHTSVVFQREDGQEVRRVQPDVHLAVHHRSARLDVGDIEEMVVGAARKTDRTAPRARAERAPSQPATIGGLARLVAVRRHASSARDDAAAVLLEPEQLRLPLDV